MYLSTVQNVFFQIAKCICSNCKVYLSMPQRVFCQIEIFRPRVFRLWDQCSNLSFSMLIPPPIQNLPNWLRLKQNMSVRVSCPWSVILAQGRIWALHNWLEITTTLGVFVYHFWDWVLHVRGKTMMEKHNMHRNLYIVYNCYEVDVSNTEICPVCDNYSMGYHGS